PARKSKARGFFFDYEAPDEAEQPKYRGSAPTMPYHPSSALDEGDTVPVAGFGSSNDWFRVRMDEILDDNDDLDGDDDSLMSPKSEAQIGGKSDLPFAWQKAYYRSGE
ncbi:hypothetical protein LTR16_003717, partial [Cryomyces antarcticus]